MTPPPKMNRLVNMNQNEHAEYDDDDDEKKYDDINDDAHVTHHHASHHQHMQTHAAVEVVVYS